MLAHPEEWQSSDFGEHDHMSDFIKIMEFLPTGSMSSFEIVVSIVAIIVAFNVSRKLPEIIKALREK